MTTAIPSTHAFNEPWHWWVRGDGDGVWRVNWYCLEWDLELPPQSAQGIGWATDYDSETQCFMHEDGDSGTRGMTGAVEGGKGEGLAGD